MKVRPFVLWGRSALRDIKEGAGNAVSAWIDQWMPIESSVETQVVVKPSLDLYHAKTFRMALLGQEDWFACEGSPDQLRNLGNLLLGVDAPLGTKAVAEDSIMGETVADALMDLGNFLLAAGADRNQQTARYVRNEALPREAFERGSGCVSLMLSLERIEIPIYLSRLAAARYVTTQLPGASREQAKATSLKEAIRHRKVPIQANLGALELRIEQLFMLEPGDVIKLEKEIDQPIDLISGDCPIICEGYLGRQDGKLAVRLSRIQPPRNALQ